jgi:hypothetical protein
MKNKILATVFTALLFLSSPFVILASVEIQMENEKDEDPLSGDTITIHIETHCSNCQPSEYTHEGEGKQS